MPFVVYLVHVVDLVSCQMGFSPIHPVNIYLEDISQFYICLASMMIYVLFKVS